MANDLLGSFANLNGTLNSLAGSLSKNDTVSRNALDAKLINAQSEFFDLQRQDPEKKQSALNLEQDSSQPAEAAEDAR